jgi:hypothetical protein
MQQDSGGIYDGNSTKQVELCKAFKFIRRMTSRLVPRGQELRMLWMNIFTSDGRLMMKA